jgi:orotate phosphoribosyltransferase
LVVEDVVLSSGARAAYFIDAKRVILQASGFRLLAEQVEHYVRHLGATVVGGLTLGADAIACAALVNGPAIEAIQAIQVPDVEICGVLAILDRLAGGAEKIEAAARAPFFPLSTIEDVYPDRPGRAGA